MLKTKSLEQAENGNSTQVERRAWVRIPCDMESVCQPLAGERGRRWPGKVCNLSGGGLAVTLARRFEVGMVLAIEVQGQSDSVQGTMYARVAHVSLQSDGTWLLGCAFTKPLNEKDAKAPQ